MKNRYAGRCDCGAHVPVEAGEAVKVNGKWVVRCADCCSELVSPGAPAYRGPANSTAAANSPLAPVAAPAGGFPTPAGANDYVLLSGHSASPYQAAVFDHFRYGRGSRLIKAVAGSGKTTTMQNAVRFLPDSLSVQMFAFNTEAAAQLSDALRELRELKDGKTYRNVRAGTFHSVGLYAIRRFRGQQGELKIDSGKCRKILKMRLCATPEGEIDYATYGSFALKLVGLAKGEGLGTRLAADTAERWYDIVDHHGLYLDTLDASIEKGIAIARQLLGWSNEAAQTAGYIDFDDMLYLVALWGLRLFRNDVVICDEAQDTNPVRRALLHLALNPGGRLYAVGDEMQSIYGFTGASTDAMQLIAREFNASELPLTVSYRCAQAVVERAQTWVPYIEASPTAATGLVMDEVPLAEALANLESTDAVLCRQTAPLVTIAYGLIARGRPCRILGKEIGEGLVNLVQSQKAKGLDRLVEKLEAWRVREEAKFIAKGDEVKAEAVNDRVQCVYAVMDSLVAEERTVPGLIRRLETMFVEPEKGETQNVLTLCTQHKAKGKEWRRVLVLRPELNPSKAARQEWQLQQEYNLMYVSATRAKEELYYAAVEDMTLTANGRNA